MRVLMTTTDHAGHFLPLVPFARACLDAGHDVQVAAPRSWRGAVERAGFEFRACADPDPTEFARVLASAAELRQRDGHARVMSDGFGGVTTRAMLPDLLEIVEDWRPHVVVHESQEYAGVLAAERHGIPHVRVALGLAAQDDETLTIAAPAVDAVRAERGLAGDIQAMRRSPVFTLVPPELEDPNVAPPADTHRFRAQRDGSRPLPDWWADADGPLVYVTFGSVAAELGLFPKLYQAVIAALAGLRARILVTVGERAEMAWLGPLPANVHVERWVAQDAVLAHAAATVCHGGYGTVLGTLTHGVPAVVVPMFGDDHFRNAARVADIGAGIALSGERGPGRRMFDGPGPDLLAALRPAVESVLGDPRYRRAASDVARSVAALPPVDTAVDVLRTIVTPAAITNRA
jgi:UDP:flavonoid glycosyltransferase YjiC (YdhE family)